MTTKRYTRDELLEAAKYWDGEVRVCDEHALDHEARKSEKIAAMLRQAAEDCEDAEKFRALTRCMDSITVEFSGLSMTIKPAPKAHVLLSAIIQGAVNATDGIDHVSTKEQAK